MKLKIAIISAILVLLIIFAVWLGYNKYLNDNYSANATVIGIVYGDILQMKIEENKLFDEGVYIINIRVPDTVVDSNGKEFNRFDLDTGDKIMITVSPSKFGVEYINTDLGIGIDGVIKIKLLDKS